MSQGAAQNERTTQTPVTPSPTPKPTSRPTPGPTPRPRTPAPVSNPFPPPSLPPTALPTRMPTLSPTPFPTERPTESPTGRPSREPTPAPTPAPTLSPTPLPTLPPTPPPTPSPTLTPTSRPTPLPTLSPTPIPTYPPIPEPTKTPTKVPTHAPTASPTGSPTPAPFTSPTSELDNFESSRTDGKSGLCDECKTNKCFSNPPPNKEVECRMLGCEYLPGCFAAPPKDLATGQVCADDDQCLSKVCRNGACMASSDCYPVKHEFGTPFDKNKVNLVFVASGFDKSTHEIWRSKVDAAYGFMQEYRPFDRTVEQLNVFLVDPRNLDPSFCYFNCGGVERLLCCNVVIAQQLSDRCFESGATLQTVVIHNDERYGGAGYTSQNIATVSISEFAPEVAVHELGHSLFELADEYYYGPGNNYDANCATKGCSKWSDLVGNTPEGYNEVTCIKGCANNAYYVSDISNMNVLNKPIGAVNERYTCCTYLALTKSMPSYCDAFNSSPNYLYNFCKGRDYQKYGASSYDVETVQAIPADLTTTDTKYVYLSDPLTVDVSLETREKSGEILAKATAGSPGLYRRESVAGDFKGPHDAARKGVDSMVKLKVWYSSGKEYLFFAKNFTVEIPSLSESSDVHDPDEPHNILEAIPSLRFTLDTRGRSVRKVKAKIVKVPLS